MLAHQENKKPITMDFLQVKVDETLYRDSMTPSNFGSNLRHSRGMESICTDIPDKCYRLSRENSWVCSEFETTVCSPGCLDRCGNDLSHSTYDLLDDDASSVRSISLPTDEQKKVSLTDSIQSVVIEDLSYNFLEDDNCEKGEVDDNDSVISDGELEVLRSSKIQSVVIEDLTLDVEEECEDGEVDDNDSVCSDGELEMKQRNSDASDSTLVGTPAEKRTTIGFSPSAKKENNYKQGSIIKEWSMFSLARSQASQLTLPTTMSTISIAQTKRSETSPAGTLRRMSRAQSRMTVEEKKAWLASVAGPEAPAVH